ncbi:MAG TPA: TatD family deoxyribonuclease [Devosia sp.]|nr:TatD family deoxyribonuclease [Devosia sp.]
MPSNAPLADSGLIDSHCHLDFDVLSNDLDGVLERMHDAGVMGCVTISTWVKEYDLIRKIAENHDDIWFSIGTHPCHAHEEQHITADDLIRLAAHVKCVGIGEAGLDYFHNADTAREQAASFRHHIMAARQTGLPLIIHARDADDDMMAILSEEAGKGAFPFVLHCYSSGPELAWRGLELGGYVSFSGIVTFRNATDILEIAKQVPDDRILVETDAPYLAPVPHRGKSNEPSFVRHTAAHLAEARGVSLQKLAEQTTANFARLFTRCRLADR